MKNNNATKKMSLLGFAAIAITTGSALNSVNAGELNKIPNTKTSYISNETKSCINDFNVNMQKVYDLTILSIVQQKEFNNFAKVVGRDEAYSLALSDKTDFSDGLEAKSITREFDKIMSGSKSDEAFRQSSQDEALQSLCETASFRAKVNKTTELLENGNNIKTASVLKLRGIN